MQASPCLARTAIVMDLDRIPLIGMLVRRMDFLGARQRVIAQNVANADTPGFKSRELSEESFAREVARATGGGLAPVAVATTTAGHMQGTRVADGAKPRPERSGDYESTPSGNAVVLEQEMTRLAETQMDYDTITGIYRKQVAMIKTALRGPSA